MKIRQIPNYPSRFSLLFATVFFIATVGTWLSLLLVFPFATSGGIIKSGEDSVSEINLQEVQSDESHSSVSKESSQFNSSLGTESLWQVYDFVYGMSGEQIFDVLIESRASQSNSISRLTQTIFLEELTWIDPVKGLTFVTQSDAELRLDFLPIVFSEWAQFDLENALAATKTLVGTQRDYALQAIFEARDDLSVEVRLSLVQANGGTASLLRLLTSNSTMRLSINDHPRRAFELILNDELEDSLQISSLYVLVEHWYEHSGPDGIGEMLEKFYESFNDRWFLLQGMVKKLAAFDPQKTWNHSLTLPPNMQRRLAPGILAVWAETDFDGALSAISETENLTQRSIALRTLYMNWARKYPEKALDNIDSIPREHRTDASSVAVKILVGQLSRENMLAKLKYLVNQGENVVRGMQYFIEHWCGQEPMAAVDWILEQRQDSKLVTIEHLAQGLEHLALIDAEKAFAIALQQSADENSIGLEYKVIQHLALNGRFSGIDVLLEQVREPGRLLAFESVGNQLLQFSRVDAAIDLASNLSESERIEYLRSLVPIALQSNPELFISSIARLPSGELLSTIVKKILNEEHYFNVLSQSEEDYLKSIVDLD